MTTPLFDEVAQIADHIFAPLISQAAVVRQWSQIDTGNNEYQIALQLVLNSLQYSRKLAIDGRLGRDMAVDIVENSAISQLLRFNRSEMCVEDRPDAPMELRQQIRELIIERTKGGMAD